MDDWAAESAGFVDERAGRRARAGCRGRRFRSSLSVSKTAVEHSDDLASAYGKICIWYIVKILRRWG